MANKLYITGFQNLIVANGTVAAPALPSVDDLTITIAGSSAQSDALGSKTRFVIIKPDADCWIAYGRDPSAVVDRHPVGAGESRFYGVFPGMKFAVLAKS